MQLLVRALDGRTSIVRIAADATVGELRAQIGSSRLFVSETSNFTRNRDGIFLASTNLGLQAPTTCASRLPAGAR